MHEPDVIRLEVERNVDDEDHASFLMGFMAPYITGADRQQNRVIRFHLENTPVGWRVSLPAFFEYADSDSNEHYIMHNQNSDWEDRQKGRKLGGLFEKAHKARFAKSPGELLEKVTADFNQGNYLNFIRFLFRPKKVEGEEDDESSLTNRYTAVAKLWKELRGKRGEDVKVTVAEKLEQGGVAVGVLRFEEVGSHKPGFQPIWMLKQESGWTMVPNQTSLTNAPLVKEHGKDANDLLAKFEKMEADLQENYLKNLLAKIPTLGDAESAPDEDAAKKL